MLKLHKGISKRNADSGYLGPEISRIGTIFTKAGLKQISVPSLLTPAGLVGSSFDRVLVNDDATFGLFWYVLVCSFGPGMPIPRRARSRQACRGRRFWPPPSRAAARSWPSCSATSCHARRGPSQVHPTGGAQGRGCRGGRVGPPCRLLYPTLYSKRRTYRDRRSGSRTRPC